MTLLPDLNAPILPVRSWWMTAVVTGQLTNARISLAHLASVPRGAILMSMANFLADTAATADADPGAGNFRWNHATQASATVLYISDVDADAGDLSAIWATIEVGAHLYLYQDDDLDVWQQWSIDSVTDASGYVKLGVSLDAFSGSFSDNAPAVITIQQADTTITADDVTIVTEAATSTMDPATHAGRSKYIRAANDVTFDNTEGYAAGEVYNIRATAAVALIGTGVTLTPPAGGTLTMAADMCVSVIMTSSSAGDVIGQTVPA